MQARMRQPVMVLPAVLQAMQAVDKAATVQGLPFVTRQLVQLRASQINGCSVCVEWHVRDLKHVGETDERLFAVSAWRETTYFTPAERAALALGEAVTRLADRPDPVPDEVWEEAARYYDEQALAALVIQIAMINTWNRLNVATRQVAGQPVSVPA
jgi:AhpD family alkylhydroperoxidase